MSVLGRKGKGALKGELETLMLVPLYRNIVTYIQNTQPSTISYNRPSHMYNRIIRFQTGVGIMISSPSHATDLEISRML